MNFKNFFIIVGTIVSLTWGCAFISEPDVGTSASGPEIFEGGYDDEPGQLDDEGALPSTGAGDFSGNSERDDEVVDGASDPSNEPPSANDAGAPYPAGDGGLDAGLIEMEPDANSHSESDLGSESDGSDN